MNNTQNAQVPAFWWRWLLVVCDIGILMGLVFLISPDFVRDNVYKLYYESKMGSDTFSALTSEQVTFQVWAYSVMGAVMVGWLLMAAFIVFIPFRRGERWAWVALAVSIGTWFVVDSLASIAYGVDINVLLNLGFLIAFDIPLMATYRHFFGAGASVRALNSSQQPA